MKIFAIVFHSDEIECEYQLERLFKAAKFPHRYFRDLRFFASPFLPSNISNSEKSNLGSKSSIISLPFAYSAWLAMPSNHIIYPFFMRFITQ